MNNFVLNTGLLSLAVWLLSCGTCVWTTNDVDTNVY